ncbi:MFS transporter [Ornithinimicrobium sp. Y1847]|uniref:MFS transporter n=1 Tax=Ornithinimicrobium sp. Y1847 TaxID=3405419 RepID=UPI003B677CAE
MRIDANTNIPVGRLSLLGVLNDPAYAKLFGAQVIALLGTGLLTVALGLLAFDIAGGQAGVVLGVAMTIKMVAYVAISPLASAVVAHVRPKVVLISADLVRVAVALCLPLVTEAWHIYLLIFLLQAASATFTPSFQALIPSVLPDERQYTRALSLSRLAYDLESLASPMLAAALLTITTYHHLFIGTALGFAVSTVLVLATRFPEIAPPAPAPFIDRLTRGTREFWASSELRGLMGLNLVVATATAMVIVNTVVLVQGTLNRTQTDVALLLAVSGAGSMLVALSVPTLLERVPDRRVMFTGGAAIPLLLLITAGVLSWLSGPTQWVALLLLWGLIGAASSTILTPSARLLRRASTDATRPAVFAAQFSLSHACFLLTYPLAGLLGATLGLPAVSVLLSAIGALGALLAARAWRHGPTSRATDDLTVRSRQ